MEAELEVGLPHRPAPLVRLVGRAPDVVDEHVQRAVVALDAGDEVAHLRRVEVVARHGDAVAAGGVDELGGLLDRLGAVHLRAPRAGRAAGHVHRRAGGAELDGDAAPRATGRAGDERHRAVQRVCSIATSVPSVLSACRRRTVDRSRHRSILWLPVTRPPARAPVVWRASRLVGSRGDDPRRCPRGRADGVGGRSGGGRRAGRLGRRRRQGRAGRRATRSASIFGAIGVRDQGSVPPFELDNRGKRSVVLDLRSDAGREAMERLLDRRRRVRHEHARRRPRPPRARSRRRPRASPGTDLRDHHRLRPRRSRRPPSRLRRRRVLGPLDARRVGRAARPAAAADPRRARRPRHRA